MTESQKYTDDYLSGSKVAEEYQMLHEVAKALHSSGSLKEMLQSVLAAITQFEELKVERKAGIFLADTEKETLNLYCTIGEFSQEFLDKEKEVPFGSCLCGRVASSGDILMSENCFDDSRHERTFSDMKAHGHYIIPLKSGNKLMGVMFLYTDTHPSWYRHSREVLLSIGGLVADAMVHMQVEEELGQYRNQLEALVESRTADLLKSVEQSQKLSHQIQLVREEEKARIAREVHDELGQLLTALKMDLCHLENKMPQDLSAQRNQVGSMMEIVDRTIKSVQRIATELRPPVLDAFGLCEAIAWQTEEYRKRLNIKFDLNCLPENPDLEGGLETALFRIFQETITNIARHAKASQVHVSLKDEKGLLILTIQDNGIGIKESDINNSGSLGLIGIRERVLPWNGRVQFKGSSEGTVVTITIPASRS